MTDKRISYRIPAEKWAEAETAASEKGLSVASFARMALLEKTADVLNKMTPHEMSEARARLSK